MFNDSGVVLLKKLNVVSIFSQKHLMDVSIPATFDHCYKIRNLMKVKCSGWLFSRMKATSISAFWQVFLYFNDYNRDQVMDESKHLLKDYV